MLSLSLPLEHMMLFFCVMVRVAAIIFVVPFLESRNVPNLVKVGLAFSIAWLILPQVQTPPPSMDQPPIVFALGIGSEVAIGLVIGLMVRLLFAGIQLAGQVAGFQMGLAIANVMDPASSLQIPILSQFLNIFAFLLFLSLNIHYYFIKAVVDGFEILPFWQAQFHGNIYEIIMKITADTFTIAVKIGAPVIAALMLTSVALGLIARTVPQMQIFIVAMPVKLILGLLFLGFSLPYCMKLITSAFVILGNQIRALMHVFA